MRKFSLIEKILMYVVTPFVGAKVFTKLTLQGKQKNGIRNGKPLTGKKNAAISKDYSIEEVKKLSKKYGVTINDVLMTITS